MRGMLCLKGGCFRSKQETCSSIRQKPKDANRQRRAGKSCSLLEIRGLGWIVKPCRIFLNPSSPPSLSEKEPVSDWPQFTESSNKAEARSLSLRNSDGA